MKTFKLIMIAFFTSISHVAMVNAEKNCQPHIHVFTNGALPWHNASKACNMRNEVLAIITNTRQVSEAYYCYRGSSTVERFWAGLRYDADEGRFIWSDGRKFHCDSNLMVILECNRTFNGNWCVLLTDEGLLLENCSAPNKYICQALSSANMNTTATISTEEGRTGIASSFETRNPQDVTARGLYQDSAMMTVSNGQTSQLLHADDVENRIALQVESDLSITSVSSQKIPQLSSVLLKPSPVYLWQIPAVETTSWIADGHNLGVKQTPKMPSPSYFHLQHSSSLQMQRQDTKETFFACERDATCHLIEEYLTNLEDLDSNDYSSLQEAVNLTEEFLERMSLRNPDANVNILASTRFLETFLLEFAKRHLSTNVPSVIIMLGKEFRFLIQSVPAKPDEKLVIPLRGSHNDTPVSIIFPPDLFQSSGAFIVVLLFNNISVVLPRQAQMSFKGKALKGSRINSFITGITVYPYQEQTLKKNINIVLKHRVIPQTQDEVKCVFWDFAESTYFNGSWSAEGCYVANSTNTETTCSCEHLTNFAVLMQIKEAEVPTVHRVALSVITYIGCTLSLLGEASAIIAYVFFVGIENDDIRIRLNLIVSIALAQIVFLSGINATFHMEICIFVAILLHYLFLVAFGWMCVEGCALYYKVVRVFNVHMRICVFGSLAWCVPLLIVALAIAVAWTSKGGIAVYIGNDFCWISPSTDLVWTFTAPVLFVIVTNFVITVSVIREMVKLQPANCSDYNDLRQAIKAFVTLFPLLGFTWLFGVLTVTDAGLLFQYIFAILNSLQGFFIFVVNVLRSREFRSALKRRTMSWSLNHKAWFLPAEMLSGSKQKDCRSHSTFERNIRVFPSSGNLGDK